jgi:ABC-type Na+ efflux pump permease subunit
LILIVEIVFVIALILVALVAYTFRPRQKPKKSAKYLERELKRHRRAMWDAVQPLRGVKAASVEQTEEARSILLNALVVETENPDDLPWEKFE